MIRGALAEERVAGTFRKAGEILDGQVREIPFCSQVLIYMGKQTQNPRFAQSPTQLRAQAGLFHGQLLPDSGGLLLGLLELSPKHLPSSHCVPVPTLTA